MKQNFKAFILAAATVFSLGCMADVPPLWAADTAAIRPDEMARAYVAPRRIVWQRGLTNAEVLLRKGTGQPEMGRRNVALMRSGDSDTASVILDYGRELHGGLQLVLGSSSRRMPSKVRIRFGESVQEACSQTCNSEWKMGFSTDDHAMRDIVMDIPRDGKIEIGNTGFRFVRIDLLQPSIQISLREATAVFRYRDIPYVGSFRCDDQRLNDIWMTGAYTVHLNMQEYIWDGIKRDRLVWLGDMHPEVSTLCAVFGYSDVIPKSLDLACRQFPLPSWMNNMTSYSMWYLIIQWEWYMQNGDRQFLEKHRPYILGLIDRFAEAVDKDGTIRGNYFLDWPSSPNKKGVESGVKALLVWAMKDAQRLCDVLGADDYRLKCQKLIDVEMRHTPPHNNLKQAAALMAIAGMMNPQKAYRNILSSHHADGFSTFYGYYILEAEALVGGYDEAMSVISDFWGGMLDMGATTFWEDFSLDWMRNTNRIDELGAADRKNCHGDFGGYCYPGFRCSLCHGWASGPTAWLSRHVLGVEVVEPGCKKVRITPHLGKLKWVEGTYPTPYGPIRIRHEKLADGTVSSAIDAPKEVTVER